jgi:hypothetical protein
MAFARLFAETMDAGQSYRDIYRPAENPRPTDKQHGDKLLRTKFVQQAVGDLLKPALIALGVDKTFALRRLIETVDGDITDYVKVVPSTNGQDNADLMSPSEIREALPLAKRRLIKKFKVSYDQYGGIKSREIELEAKQPALELLAKMQGWIKTDAHIHIDGDEMMRKIDEARAAAPLQAEVIRGTFKDLKTFQQLQRPATLQLPAPVKSDPPTEGK